MNLPIELKLRSNLVLMKRDAHYLIYNPLWGKPIFANEKLLSLLYSFRDPRPVQDLVNKDYRLVSKLAELTWAGVLGSAHETDIKCWRAYNFPDDHLLLPHQILLSPRRRKVDATLLYLQPIISLLRDLHTVSNTPTSIVVENILSDKHWSFLCSFLQMLWEELDYFDHIDLVLDNPCGIPSKATLESLKRFTLGIRLLSENLSPEWTNNSMEQIMSDGHILLLVYKHGGLNEHSEHIFKECLKLNINTIWIEPSVSLLDGPPEDLLSWTLKMREESLELGIRTLGFWELPAILFEKRAKPAAFYPPVYVDCGRDEISIMDRRIQIADLGIDFILKTTKSLEIGLPPVECNGCLALAHCMGAVKNRYGDQDANCCWLTREMFQLFLQEQFQLAFGEKEK